MDLNDVSQSRDYRAILMNLAQAAQRAAARKGELPRDHVPLPILEATYMMRRTMRRPLLSEGSQIQTTQIPRAYPPSLKSESDLSPISIRQLTLETHHRSTKIFLRVVTPPDRMNAAMAIVEDQDGSGCLIQLYHLPPAVEVPTEKILYQGGILLLKEPYFKVTTDGMYSLRVDHVNDIIWLTRDDTRIPPKWRQQYVEEVLTSHEIRMHGNEAVQKQKWAEAMDLYTSAIAAAETTEEARVARLNRSLANLKLGHVDDALADATQEEPSERQLFRAAQALYALGRYKESTEKYAILSEKFPEAAAGRSEIVRAQLRLQEQLTGTYSFSQMYKAAKAEIPTIDCATFSAPMEIRPSPKRGRGLFTKRAVVAGELLLCEKAFGYCYADGDSQKGRSLTMILMSLEPKKMTMGGQAHLITQIVQKLQHNPESSQAFLALHPGKYKPVLVRQVDGKPIVDTFLVWNIISSNSFGAPRTSRQNIKAVIQQVGPKATETDYGTCGIWTIASHVNHSCAGNCRRSFIGDMQIIRATRDMPADTELNFNYTPTTKHATYDETQNKLRSWGFKCDCPLCVARKATSDATLAQRKRLFQKLTKIMGPGIPMQTIKTKRALAVLSEIEATYAKPVRDSAVEPCVVTPRVELSDPYVAVGAALLMKGKPAASINVVVKGLEAVGFDMMATWPGAGGGGELTVRSWGVLTEDVALAFLTLFRAYRLTCPQLAGKAKAYLITVCTMLAGEGESASEIFPEMF